MSKDGVISVPVDFILKRMKETKCVPPFYPFDLETGELSSVAIEIFGIAPEDEKKINDAVHQMFQTLNDTRVEKSKLLRSSDAGVVLEIPPGGDEMLNGLESLLSECKLPQKTGEIFKACILGSHELEFYWKRLRIVPFNVDSERGMSYGIHTQASDGSWNYRSTLGQRNIFDPTPTDRARFGGIIGAIQQLMPKSP